jgi:hypothetical protein
VKFVSFLSTRKVELNILGADRKDRVKWLLLIPHQLALQGRSPGEFNLTAELARTVSDLQRPSGQRGRKNRLPLELIPRWWQFNQSVITISVNLKLKFFYILPGEISSTCSFLKSSLNY